MEFQKGAVPVLRNLFSEYKKGPAVLYPINSAAAKAHVDPHELSDFLLEKGWIRERWIYATGVVACRITIAGINQVDPSYVRTWIDRILGSVSRVGGKQPLLEVLERDVAEFSVASDMVNQMEKMGLIKLANPDNSIVIEMTDIGREVAERRRHELPNLILA